MTEEIVALSDTLAGIFDSTKGRAYLEDLVQRYPKCSAKVQGSSLFLAAFKEEDLQAFKTEFERNILHQICKACIYIYAVEHLQLFSERNYLGRSLSCFSLMLVLQDGIGRGERCTRLTGTVQDFTVVGGSSIL